MHLIVIVGVFLALLAGESVDTAPTATPAFWWGNGTTRTILPFMAGTIILTWSLMRVTARFVLMRLQRLPWPDRRALRRSARIESTMRVLVLLVFAVQLWVGGWAELVCHSWHLRRFVLFWELCLILPFALLLLLKWDCFYPVNRFIREFIVAGQLADGLSARPVWSRTQYLSFQLRNGLLLILVPLLMIFAFRDMVEWLALHFFSPQSGGDLSSRTVLLSEIVTAAGSGVIFVLSPLILRYVWLTRRLPDGPLRQRLSCFCQNLRLRYRDILLWDTYSSVANAAVMGLLGPIRYILLSDAIIENMPDEQIEAVFGHEAGHVKHHHIFFLVMYVLGAGLTGGLLTEAVARVLNGPCAGYAFVASYKEVMFAVCSAVVVLLWLLLFGWISRRFERQADLHAAVVLDRFTANEESLAMLNPSDTFVNSPRGPLVVAAALERIAFLNGISMDSRSWRHFSLARRVGFLRQLALEPQSAPRFARLILRIKIAILIAVVVGVAGWCALWLGR